MKKILSLVLALLMLAVSVSAVAEDALAASAGEKVSALTGMNFAKKYLDEGQRLVTNVTVEPGIVLLASVEEEMQTPLQELLQSLTIQVTGQKAENNVQGALRLYLGEEEAADIIVAGDVVTGLYAASSFLGNTTLQVTPAQLKNLVNMYVQQMIESGQMTQEQYDAIVSGFNAFRENPQAVMASLLGDLDLSGLQEALYELIDFQMEMRTLSEVPEEVDIPAQYLVTIPLKKDALRNVTSELAKLIWSIPAVQQVAPSVTINDAELTEERLSAVLNFIPDVLAEDLEIRLYFAADLQTWQAVSDVRLNANGDLIPMQVKVLGETAEDGAHTIWSMKMDIDEASTYAMTGDMTVTMMEAGALISYEVTAEMTENGTAWNPVYMTVNALVGIQENDYTMVAEILSRAKTSAEADPLGVVFSVGITAEDMEDHAELAAIGSAALENIGDIVTVQVNQYTDLAEAYIITDDAVQPMELSEEEMGSLGQQLTMSALSGVITLVQKLPESVRPFAMQLLNMQ